MVKEKKRLPVGLENFEQIINDNYYYVDKTCLLYTSCANLRLN